ncbi:MAG: transcriptional repressor LexA [Alphaproteobacteria bacterium]|nr:transcriptional repressor LexA [Alphaproteobacteria bacterium]
MLTKKQHNLLLFIAKKIEKQGVSPSYDEMREALDLKSKSGIFRLLNALEERGFIRRLPHRARALEVVKLPQAKVTTISKGITDFPPTAEEVEIPLYGKIAAGTPIEAVRDMETRIPVPTSLMGRGEHYALKIEGDSMIDVGIMDGDTVIIQRSDTAENGEIVVALVDGLEVTLKRFRRQGSSIALEPENPAYQTRILPASRVRVQGKLVALMRRY